MSNIIEIADVLAYIGIDYADDMVERNISRQIGVAEKFVIGSIGENFPRDDDRIKEIMLMVVADLYEHRGILTSTTAGNARKLLHDLSLQIRLEMRRRGQ